MNHAEIVKHSTGYEHADLETAFRWVADPEDWKAPIDALVPEHKLEIVLAAIEYFTATEATTERHAFGGYYRVRSIGYRAGPAGP